MTETHSIQLLQITDTHLYADPEGRLKGVRTERSLNAVIEQVLATAPPFEFVLSTGDLVHDDSDAAYERFRSQLQRLGRPVFCLPGNHDELEKLRQHLNTEPFHSNRSLRAGPWLLVFLDSSLPGSPAGHLSEVELDALDRTIRGHDARHVLICVHHHPRPLGSAWMDTMVIDNGDELLRRAVRHGRVRGILCGHIHQEYDTELQGMRLLGPPSTCIAVLPGRDVYALDTAPPGWRWLRLQPDGTIDTGVVRLPAPTDTLDPEAEYG
mgnify:CR=1 FL=1